MHVFLGHGTTLVDTVERSTQSLTHSELLWRVDPLNRAVLAIDLNSSWHVKKVKTIKQLLKKRKKTYVDNEDEMLCWDVFFNKTIGLRREKEVSRET